ncbi:S-adenosylhomocysteine hydrolase [Massilia sp. CCM 8733]|uniref:S-adenosylhomocysteine hydrolase n=1 Tax=Massilia mucilaginosa TaxID=2609282 RepID=A0ABX0NLN2_9BURK|nr:DUF6088 family protein [Massilia mucilaginosa]NHZ87712.1 S-adenosylhomocysteine hydrolase [Massilia mucilaginosa]
MNVQEKVVRSIANRRGNVILRSDLNKFGSESQVSRVINSMVGSGKLIRAGKGVFVKTKVSSITGNIIPAATLETVATETFKKLKVNVLPSKATQDYNSGKTTQLPTSLIIRTPKRKISRKLTVAGRTLEYEKNSR